jgi:hypothetical protein
MRYIGAGGSPKADDPSTLKAGQFTLSLVHQPVGKYAACHSMRWSNTSWCWRGVLNVGWVWGDETDMALNQVSRPHGFRKRRGRASADVDQRRQRHAETAGLRLPPVR